MILETIEKSAFALSDQIFSLIPTRKPSLKKIRAAKIVAHRGLYDNKKIFENTCEAFQRCLEENIFGIEFDVRWTKDLIPVVFHDVTLERVFSDPTRLCDLTWEELHKNHPKIPKLQDVINQFGGELHLMIELKSDPIFDKKSKVGQFHQFKKIQSALTQLRPVKDYHYLGFETELFGYFDETPSQTFIPIAQLNLPQTLKLVKKNNYGGLACHYALLSRYYRKLFRFENVKVGVGYIDSINNFNLQCHNSVEWMFTNRPLLLNNYIKYQTRKIN